MLRIAFLDPIPQGYTVDTPRQRPLGGSQSALCYLAEAMARRGHAVSLCSNIPSPVQERGVACIGLGLSPDFLKSLDVVVVNNVANGDIVHQYRHRCAPHTRFVLWVHHAHDQPCVAPLADPQVRALWDGFALISDWQCRQYRDRFDIEPARVGLMRNAVAPAFLGLFQDGQSIRTHKSWPPVLAYTSTPFRGLDRLVEAFPEVRRRIPGARLKVFSSMKVYDATGGSDGDGFAALYARCRATEGVDYIGSVAQPELARALTGVTCLAYPNIFPETSCIAAMEAMAAGCLVVTSNLGALPETLAGFGHLTAIMADPLRHAGHFAAELVRVLDVWHGNPDAVEQHLYRQVAHANNENTWDNRARQWTAWLEQLAGNFGGSETATVSPEKI